MVLGSGRRSAVFPSGSLGLDEPYPRISWLGAVLDPVVRSLDVRNWNLVGYIVALSIVLVVLVMLKILARPQRLVRAKRSLGHAFRTSARD